MSAKQQCALVVLAYLLVVAAVYGEGSQESGK